MMAKGTLLPLHAPFAFVSRALFSTRDHGIAELETLAISHYHALLYKGVVRTDHSAVKAVLETPNPNGRHARW